MLDYNLLQKIEIFFSQFNMFDYKKREIIKGLENTSNIVFYIKKGFVRVYGVSEEGEELTLAILRSQDIFPFVFRVPELLNNYYLEALTTVEIIRAPKERFLQFMEKNPRVFYQLFNYVLTNFAGLLNRMEYMVFGTAYTKVASTILACARRFGENQGLYIIVDLPLTHRDIATLVGITRETTCLEMKKLERKGVIAHQGRKLLIRDIKKLEEESALHSESGFWLGHSLKLQG